MVGNGCRKGLGRLYPGVQLSPRTLLEVLHAWHGHITPKAKKLFSNNAGKWCLQAAKHTPCEWIKFWLGVIYFAGVFGLRLDGVAQREEGLAPPRARRSRSLPAFSQQLFKYHLEANAFYSLRMGFGKTPSWCSPGACFEAALPQRAAYHKFVSRCALRLSLAR